MSETAVDVVRDHWKRAHPAGEAIEAAAEKAPEPEVVEVGMPRAQIATTEETPIAPAETETTAATTATTTDDQPPNKGDNGRNRVEPISAKKLMLSLVAVKRITSDVPVCNEDRNELEIAGELAEGARRFCDSQARCCETVTGTRLLPGIFSFTWQFWRDN